MKKILIVPMCIYETILIPTAFIAGIINKKLGLKICEHAEKLPQKEWYLS